MKAGKLFITWQHKNPECVCVIKDDSQGGKVVSTGVATTHYTDNYEKKIGRKISLLRALESIDNKSIEKVWTEYNKVCK